jgi:flagella basal body P-ring formation protein FlgA
MIALALSVSAAAQEIQPLEGIRDAVRAFLDVEVKVPAGATPRITVGQLDERLRLVACERPLEPFMPPGGRSLGNISVGVRCEGAKPWSLYVQASVEAMAPVVVTARPLGRGEVLTQADLATEETDLARLTGGYLIETREAVGLTLKRSVRAGQVLTPGLLQARLVVRRGERVVILAEAAGLEVRMEGEALEDGAEGQLIRVRNRGSKREVEAAVVAPGIVRVRM